MSPVDQLPVVVVGGGTAGLSFVCEFVQHSSYPVILFEPGRAVLEDSRRFFNVVVPQNVRPNFGAVLVEGTPKVPYVQAQAFGGGSAINGMLNDQLPGNDLSPYVCPEPSDVGPLAHALINSGGVIAPLAWNKNNRLNDVATVRELISSGRVSVIQQFVDSLLVQDGRVVGVRAGGQEVSAAHVVLTAGVVSSTALLSAHQDFLERFQIGENISDHPCLTATLMLKKDAPAHIFDAGAYKYVQLANEHSFVVIAYERGGHHDEKMGLLSIVLLSPKSRGRIGRVGSELVPHMNMLSNEEDVLAMREAARELTKILARQDFAELSDSISVGTSNDSLVDVMNMTDAALDSWLRNNLSPVSHISGGCSEVSDQIPGLVVADASALNQVPYGFPNHSVRVFARNVGQKLGGLYT